MNLLHPIDPGINESAGSGQERRFAGDKTNGQGSRHPVYGDIGQKAENRLISSGQDLRAEILKVPHHGSSTSSSTQFIDAVQPRYAIFSLGRSSQYRFPHPDVVARYHARGCVQLRTDTSAAITIRTDGRRCWIEALE